MIILNFFIAITPGILIKKTYNAKLFQQKKLRDLIGTTRSCAGDEIYR